MPHSRVLAFIDAGRQTKVRRPSSVEMAMMKAGYLLQAGRDSLRPVIYLTTDFAAFDGIRRRDVLRPKPTDILIGHFINASLFENRKFTDLICDWEIKEIAVIGGSIDGVVLRTLVDEICDQSKWVIVRDAVWTDRNETAAASSVKIVIDSILERRASHITSKEFVDRLTVDAKA
ncbi:MAG: hypothetical protein BGP06_09520 [Rhizobiales bacterium 65-9]|nr:MAG: hypothetical protein BGP06_09520 [Rhizobiales bacterium 65-9]